MPITTQPNQDSLLAKRRQQRRIQTKTNDTPTSPSIVKKKLMLFFLVTMYVLAAIIAWRTKLFTIQQIDCRMSDSSNCSDNLHDQLSYYLEGKPIFSSLQARIDQAFSHHTVYQLQKYQRQLPDTLIVYAQVLEQAYHVEQNGQKWTVDKSGTVHRYSEQKLPIVYLDHLAIEEATTLDSNLHAQLAQLAAVLKTTELPNTTIHWVSNSEIRLKLNESQTVLLKLDSLPAQLSLFQKLKDYPLEKPDWQELDLRFDKPVVR